MRVLQFATLVLLFLSASAAPAVEFTLSREDILTAVRTWASNRGGLAAPNAAAGIAEVGSEWQTGRFILDCAEEIMRPIGPSETFFYSSRQFPALPGLCVAHASFWSEPVNSDACVVVVDPKSGYCDEFIPNRQFLTKVPESPDQRARAVGYLQAALVWIMYDRENYDSFGGRGVFQVTMLSNPRDLATAISDKVKLDSVTGPGIEDRSIYDIDRLGPAQPELSESGELRRQQNWNQGVSYPDAETRYYATKARRVPSDSITQAITPPRVSIQESTASIEFDAFCWVLGTDFSGYQVFEYGLEFEITRFGMSAVGPSEVGGSSRTY